MNPGKLKDRVELMRRVKRKNAGGQQIYEYVTVIKMRGNFREVPSKDILDNAIQVNVRSGTLYSRYYPSADESMYMRINDKLIYRIKGFNHDDYNTATTFALEWLKVPEDG